MQSTNRHLWPLAFAPNDLPKLRLCANVVFAAAEGELALRLAVKELKLCLGKNWSPVTAFQYMSGRDAKFAAESAASHERAQLYLAHLVAKQVCSNEGLGAAAPPDGIDAAKFHSLVASVKTHFE